MSFGMPAKISRSKMAQAFVLGKSADEVRGCAPCGSIRREGELSVLCAVPAEIGSFPVL